MAKGRSAEATYRGSSLFLKKLIIAVAAVFVPYTALTAQDAKAVDAGRKIYVAEKCQVCHQIAGRGNARFPLDRVGARRSAAELRRWFTHTVDMENALPKRPAIKMSSRKYNFSDAELDALVAYLLTLK